MEKFETHLHTGGTSLCALVPPEQIPALYKKHGYDGIIVTDHYMQYILDRFGEKNFTRQIDNLLAGYRTVKKSGEALGLKVWLGIELNLENYNDNGMPAMEFLIHGEKVEEVLYGHPFLNRYTQQELYDLCGENGLLMFQAHPFRGYASLAEPQFLDGIEVYNGNPRHESHNGTAKSYARENGLMAISGSDFHLLGDENRGGIYLPDGILSPSEMVKCFKEGGVKLYTGD